jgi:hypothetical protein
MVLWVQDNTSSVKFYKKLGFEVISSDDYVSTVRLGNFDISLVTMRDENEFNHDSPRRVTRAAVRTYMFASTTSIPCMLNFRKIAPCPPPPHVTGIGTTASSLLKTPTVTNFAFGNLFYK